MNPHFDDLGNGIRHYRSLLSHQTQSDLCTEVQRLAEAAGWLSPVTPGGQPFSVAQVNFGPLGWVSDRRGYRYQATHPVTGAPWPEMPHAVTQLWDDLLPDAPPPECCLVNHYKGTARMGLHRDADEDDQSTPILSVSLGQPARFRIGNATRRGPTRSVVLSSGDVIVLGGPSRLYHHGIDRLLPGDPLFGPDLPVEGRLNLTLRRVSLA